MFRAARLGMLIAAAVVAGPVSVVVAAAPGGVRTWTDHTGTHRIDAELVRVTDNEVDLKTIGGRTVTVPLSRLSAADREYVKSLQQPPAAAPPSGAGAKDKSEIQYGDVPILGELARPTQFEFVKTPLADAVRRLAEQHRLAVYVDRRALDRVGIRTDVRVTCRSQAGTLGDNLKQLLKPLGLAWDLRCGVLIITTPEQAESHLRVMVYKVLQPGDARALLKGITGRIAPTTWDFNGGPASIAHAAFARALVVSQTLRVHLQIAEHHAEELAVVEPPAPAATGGKKSLDQLLRQPVRLEFHATPLGELADDLKKTHGVPVTVDLRALDKVGLGRQTPVDFQMRGVPLGAALSLLLGELGLTWQRSKTGIEITTPEEAARNLVLIAYPAADLAGGQRDPLIKVITATIAPVSWNQVGGPASIRPGAPGKLDVLQTPHVHAEIQSVLAALRRASSKR
jgi:hypothetical protein